MSRAMQKSTFFAVGLAGVMIIVIGTGLWYVTGVPTLAQVPDSGAQFNEMIKELRVSNQKLTEIAALLREIRDAQGGPAKEKEPKPSPPAAIRP